MVMVYSLVPRSLESLGMRPGRKRVEVELTLTEMYTTQSCLLHTTTFEWRSQTMCVQTWHITYINNNIITIHDKIPTEKEGFCLFGLKVLH